MSLFLQSLLSGRQPACTFDFFVFWHTPLLGIYVNGSCHEDKEITWRSALFSKASLFFPILSTLDGAFVRGKQMTLKSRNESCSSFSLFVRRLQLSFFCRRFCLDCVLLNYVKLLEPFWYWFISVHFEGHVSYELEWYSWGFCLGLKQPGCEADPSPSGAEELYLCSPECLHGVDTPLTFFILLFIFFFYFRWFGFSSTSHQYVNVSRRLIS
jgi:hypothetical protein